MTERLLRSGVQQQHVPVVYRDLSTGQICVPIHNVSLVFNVCSHDRSPSGKQNRQVNSLTARSLVSFQYLPTSDACVLGARAAVSLFRFILATRSVYHYCMYSLNRPAVVCHMTRLLLLVYEY